MVGGMCEVVCSKRKAKISNEVLLWSEFIMAFTTTVSKPIDLE